MVEELLLKEDYISALRRERKSILLYGMGNGADKVSEVIKHKNAEFILGVRPNAADMIALSEKAYREQDFLDLAYSTPNYLKKFYATVPKKNVLK